jgi:hypothetical protein
VIRNGNLSSEKKFLSVSLSSFFFLSEAYQAPKSNLGEIPSKSLWLVKVSRDSSRVPNTKTLNFFTFSAEGRKVFRSFLRCEYSEENILFWLACEDLKKERSPELIEEKARIIYEDYVSILSPREVNRVAKLCTKSRGGFHLHTF